MRFFKLHTKSDTETICEDCAKNPEEKIWHPSDSEITIKLHDMMTPSILENMSFTLQCDACGLSHTHMTKRAKAAGMKEWQFKPSPKNYDFAIYRNP